MDNSFHYLLMANQALVHKSLLEKLKDTELTIGQPKILDYLQKNDGASQKDIAKACFIEPGSLTSILNRMEEKKMIERKMLNGNRRSLYVFMTPYGKTLMNNVTKSFALLEEKAFKDISDEEKEQFAKIFLKIFDNLQKKE